MNEPAPFPVDYASARRCFRDLATACGAACNILPVDARGPGGESLSIDIAWLGAPDARRVVIHQSGIHGVEGFSGSAIQCALLGTPPTIGPNEAVVLVHCLNPYGMAWLRRVNEHNVDLNRNCLDSPAAYRGAHPLYRRLNPWLNPTSATGPRFWPRVITAVLRHGFKPLQQAIAAGQYEFAHGLFYGGRQLEPGLARYRKWLQGTLSVPNEIVVIDSHSGLGLYGHETLFAERGDEAVFDALRAARGRPVHTPRDAGFAYRARGNIGNLVAACCPAARVTCLTEEFGTAPPLAILRALREEQRAYRRGATDPAHPARQRLKTVFAPPAPRWRQQTVSQGVRLVRLVLTMAGQVAARQP